MIQLYPAEDGFLSSDFLIRKIKQCNISKKAQEYPAYQPLTMTKLIKILFNSRIFRRIPRSCPGGRILKFKHLQRSSISVFVLHPLV